MRQSKPPEVGQSKLHLPDPLADAFFEMMDLLDQQNVPKEGRIMLCNPNVAQAIIRTLGEHVVKDTSVHADPNMVDGALGVIHKEPKK